MILQKKNSSTPMPTTSDVASSTSLYRCVNCGNALQVSFKSSTLSPSSSFLPHTSSEVSDRKETQNGLSFVLTDSDLTSWQGLPPIDPSALQNASKEGDNTACLPSLSLHPNAKGSNEIQEKTPNEENAEPYGALKESSLIPPAGKIDACIEEQATEMETQSRIEPFLLVNTLSSPSCPLSPGHISGKGLKETPDLLRVPSSSEKRLPSSQGVPSPSSRRNSMSSTASPACVDLTGRMRFSPSEEGFEGDGFGWNSDNSPPLASSPFLNPSGAVSLSREERRLSYASVTSSRPSTPAKQGVASQITPGSLFIASTSSPHDELLLRDSKDLPEGNSLPIVSIIAEEFLERISECQDPIISLSARATASPLMGTPPHSLPPVNMHAIIEQTERCLTYFSGSIPLIEHPLCDGCAQRVFELCKRLLEDSEHEFRTYHEALLSLAGNVDAPATYTKDEGVGEGVEDVCFQKREAISSGDFLPSAADSMTAFSQLDLSYDALQEETEAMEMEIACLDLTEWKNWFDFSKYLQAVACHEEDLAATNAAIEYMSKQLEILKHANVIQDTFYIDCSGDFGSINGFRMAQFVSHNISWDEINSAWGQVCLLLEVLLRKANIQLSHYRLVPRGNYSLLIRKSDNVRFELYNNESPFFRIFSGGRFNQAMVAFLHCMVETLELLRRYQPSNEPPYTYPFRIEEEQIEGFSIRLQLNQNERWTQALKLMLQNLHWLSNTIEKKSKIADHPFA
ncbi:hypothetical protein IE077_001371 [Cardiosporidium cionae]|uniref:Atg6 BARA domain-containing protein n=1 Tax=Cardiosporidium cionae TaxID=476202 RepID=A0ABQ7J5F4_9APIC|nr:hypothetical protein IE077_001371 [Cardiosporidium cionae]|eukprot:KAF8819223.1 hypothetical protein IE077_001371 [Cardiosporidium cionae]